MAVDAITASPYLGFGSLQPIIDTALANDAGVFVLALTSNKEGPEVQHATTASGRTVGGSILDRLRVLNAGATPLGSLGAVVGATIGDTGEDFDINGPLLVPGFGAQGGTVDDLRRLFGTTGPQRPAQLVARDPAGGAVGRTAPGGGQPCPGERCVVEPGMTRHKLIVLALLTAVLAAGLAGCSSPEEAYCDAVEEHQTELGRLSDEGGPEAVLDELPTLEALAADAPTDLKDEWQLLITAVKALDRAFADAGVDPAAYDAKHPPADLSDDDRLKIESAATSLGSDSVTTATSGIEQQSLDVCKSRSG